MELNAELRFGNTAALLFAAVGMKPIRQIDMLDLFFPDLFVEEIPAEEGERKEAEFDDQRLMIRAVRIDDSFYIGASRRVSQILGRLNGTAKGNQEKERRTAELMQKQAAEIMCSDMECILALQENTAALLASLNDEEQEVFVYLLGTFLNRLMLREEEECDRDILFPLDREVFEGIVYHAFKQYQRENEEGTVNAYLWLLIGSLLRNESGRVLRLFDSSFINVSRQPGENSSFAERMYYLLHPEEYESVYYGDELDRKYPGIEFYCDQCGAHLNEQEDFDDHVGEWKCRACGFVNEISEHVIYESLEDRRMGKEPLDGEDIMRAIRRRREEENQ